MLLEEFCQLKDNGIFLLSDTIQQSYLPLLKKVLQRADDIKLPTLCITTESPPSRLARKSITTETLSYHESWTQTQLDVFKERTLAFLKKNNTSLVVIESINPILYRFSSKFLQFLNHLKNHFNSHRILLTYHADISDQRSDSFSNNISSCFLIHPALKRLSRVSIQVHPLKDINPLSLDEEPFLLQSANGKSMLCTIFKRKVNGRIVQNSSLFSYDSSSNSWNIEIHDESNHRGPSDNQEPISTAQLATFNLNLSEEQRSAKANLILPYTEIQHNESALITYHPDEADDFDEDDPDDDLLI